MRDEVMTSVSKGESGSEREEVLIPDLDQRMEQEALSPDQETAGFLTPRMNKYNLSFTIKDSFLFDRIFL
jgi:hypothetical protein